MELKYYFQLIQRWIWLLILGLVLGIGGGYAFSQWQEPVYQASTRALVVRAPLEQSSDLTYYNDKQLVQTYVQLLTTQTVLDGASQRLGYDVKKTQLVVRQDQDTQIIDVVVEDHDPQHATDIANVLVDVLIEKSNTLQSGRYITTEESIQAQITQVENQISNVQSDIDQMSTANFQDQLGQVKLQIGPLQDEVSSLQQEIARLSPARTQLQKTQIAEKEARINQIKPLLDLYQQIYSNLVVLGKPVDLGSENNSRLTQLQSTLDLYQQLYINLLSSLETIRLARLQNTPNIVQIEVASKPIDPIRPRPVTNIAMAGAIGLILAVGIAFLIEYLDDTLKTPEDVEQLLGVPVLGFVATMPVKQNHAKDIFIVRHPHSPVSEAFRSLRTNLESASSQKPIRTLLVTSTGPSEGKTTIATNLAVAFSHNKKRVVLMDADMRRPHVNRLFGMANRKGLSNLLTGAEQISNIGKVRKDLPNLLVITSGSPPPNPTELLGSTKMGLILNELGNLADITIIDTPPSLVSDAQILAARVDAVLFVIQPGETSANVVEAALESFKRSGARVVGVVMNRIPKNRDYYYGGYRYYSSYGKNNHYYAEVDVKYSTGDAVHPAMQHLVRTAAEPLVQKTEQVPQEKQEPRPFVQVQESSDRKFAELSVWDTRDNDNFISDEDDDVHPSLEKLFENANVLPSRYKPNPHNNNGWK